MPSMVEKTSLPIIHSKFTPTQKGEQMETLPGAIAPPNNQLDTTSAAAAAASSSDTQEDNNADVVAKKLPSLPPPPKSPSPLKDVPAKKKMVVKPKLPSRLTRVVEMSECSQQELPPARKENEEKEQEQLQEQQQPPPPPVREEKNEETPLEQEQKKREQRRIPLPTAFANDDTSMYDEPLPVPGLNTVTPPTKSRDAKVLLHLPNAASVDTEQSNEEARDIGKQRGMRNSMNVDARANGTPQQKPEELLMKAAGSISTFSKQSSLSLKVDHGPPVVHTPADSFDPESIDTICAEIYERKQQNGCTKFPLCLCNQTPCVKKSLTSSLRLKKSSYQEML
jgi:hypothetical protein